MLTWTRWTWPFRSKRGPEAWVAERSLSIRGRHSSTLLSTLLESIMSPIQRTQST